MGENSNKCEKVYLLKDVSSFYKLSKPEQLENIVSNWENITSCYCYGSPNPCTQCDTCVQCYNCDVGRPRPFLGNKFN